MTLLLAVCVAVLFTVSVYLLLARELKAVCMGVFLLGHGANLGIIAMAGQPLAVTPEGVDAKGPPLLTTSLMPVDPLPQALILTAIVISFATMAFLLTLIVVTHRTTHQLGVDDLAKAGALEPPAPAGGG